jgi:DegV family protein with EDD domain
MRNSLERNMVQIIGDTTSCLPEAIQRKYHIPLVPQMIHFGEDSYTEGTDIDTDSFLSLLGASKILPKTSAPPPELFRSLFQKLGTPDQALVCIHPSKELSGTVRSAETARLDFSTLDIRIIDTRLVASPLGTVVHQAARWAAAGDSADSICHKINALAERCQLYFLVSTLDFLARGGRIGGASALVGNALQIKPILTLANGTVEQYAKERTFKRALAHLKTLVLDQYPSASEGFLSIMHAGTPALAQELGSYFEEQLKIDPPVISYLPPAIITHAGPGSLAVGFFR